MAKRNSPKDIKFLGDLSDLDKIVVDKRNDKRMTEKRNRRDRHYQKAFIKFALKDTVEKDAIQSDEDTDGSIQSVIELKVVKKN
jgi:hypothetical protein